MRKERRTFQLANIDHLQLDLEVKDCSRKKVFKPDLYVMQDCLSKRVLSVMMLRHSPTGPELITLYPPHAIQPHRIIADGGPGIRPAKSAPSPDNVSKSAKPKKKRKTRLRDKFPSFKMDRTVQKKSLITPEYLKAIISSELSKRKNISGKEDKNAD